MMCVNKVTHERVRCCKWWTSYNPLSGVRWQWYNKSRHVSTRICV